MDAFDYAYRPMPYFKLGLQSQHLHAESKEDVSQGSWYAFLISVMSSTCPAHLIPSSFNRFNNIWKNTQIMKLFIM
jgi:hypothetical protein